jgi:hypothetical protein
MAKKQTEKSRYPSKYTDKFISEPQFICEKLCEKIAKYEKTTLPYKFWELTEWKKLFRRHIVEANRLLKNYSVEQILQAIDDPYLLKKNFYSFRFPPFIKILEKISSRKETSIDYTKIELMPYQKETVRDAFHRQSVPQTLRKLRDL